MREPPYHCHFVYSSSTHGTVRMLCGLDGLNKRLLWIPSREHTVVNGRMLNAYLLSHHPLMVLYVCCVDWMG